MFQKANVIVACSALTLLLAGGAQAWGSWGEIRIDSQIAGTGVFTADRVSDGVGETRGAPGRGSLRTFSQLGALGPPSAHCDGFDFEIPVVFGSGVVTFADLSQLRAVQTSGYVCGSLEGARNTVAEGVIVGGSGRFEGATGTVTFETEGEALNPETGITAWTGTITGSARIEN
jgi:hypothetical protein